MPRLSWSAPALDDVARLRAFLLPVSTDAAHRAVKAIRSGVQVLGKHPSLGHSADDLLPGAREWIVSFGNSAYVVLYRFDGSAITILAVRHGREAGY